MYCADYEFVMECENILKKSLDVHNFNVPLPAH
jgi:hypothetical protein